MELGRYSILRRIAKGGMAELYLARQGGPASLGGFEKLVVVKRILPELSRDAEFVRMFLDEARLAAGLHHSNIVQVYDIGEAADGYFFAMEYLHGEDLRYVMRAVEAENARVPIEHALSIILGVCAGLHYAHERSGSDGRPLGIVHRDVSPHNVFVTWDGGVKVLDFGIAKAARRLSETRTGALKGKIQYMSPEQVHGDPIDRRSDVFAIAILLWELTVGRRLYSGKSDLAIMKAVAEEDAPPPSRLMPDYPPELEQIVMQGLARRPDDRFATAEAMQLAVEEFARARRLALSPVGLSRWLGERFDSDVEGWTTAQRGGVEAMTHYAMSRLERRPGADDAAGESRPRTRAIGNAPPPRPRRRRALFMAIAMVTALVSAGAAVALLRQTAAPAPAPIAPPPAAKIVELPAPAPIAATPVAPAAAEPEPQQPTERPAKKTKRTRVTRSHARARHVDLDSPLPPK